MATAGRLLRIALGSAGWGPREQRLRAAVAGRTVLITGASEGIGEAVAYRLAAAGAHVVLVARTAERLSVVRDRIVATGGTADAHPADLSDSASVSALADELERRYELDVVVSNAGRSIRRSLSESAGRFHDFQRTNAVNYLGPVQLLLGVLPSMRRRGGGLVVNVSTAGILFPAPRWSAYLASKAAFDVWLRCAAPELRTDGIAVSTVYFGLVRTRMSAPTSALRGLPGMSAEEAAAVVCRAIAGRPRTIAPWWGRLGEVVSVSAKRPVEAALARAEAAGLGPEEMFLRPVLRPLSKLSRWVRDLVRR
jgi:short-subunit dehydrogenase